MNKSSERFSIREKLLKHGKFLLILKNIVDKL